jgi:colicin import membrane protein
MTDATPYHIPAEPGRWRAFTLAAVMHLLLVALLWFSVHWTSEVPIAIEAEVWSPQVKEAAPIAPAPEPEPEVKPEPEPVIAPPPPEPVVEEVPKIDPEIALRAEKKRKDALLKKERDERERKEKLLEDKKRIEKEKADALAKKRALEDEKKLAADKKKKLDKSEQDRAAKVHDDEVKRMMAQAGSGGAATAAQAQGARGDASYLAKVAAKIKSNTIFNVSEGVQGNPPVEYQVDLLPDGSVRRPIKKIRPSGIPGFDEAVLNAIEKSQPFPPDKTGSVPPSINVIHKPKD